MGKGARRKEKITNHRCNSKPHGISYGISRATRTFAGLTFSAGRANWLRDSAPRRPGARHFPRQRRLCGKGPNVVDFAGVEVLAIVDGAAPNAPREDLARITSAIARRTPDVAVSFGGGSTIDAVKAAEVSALGGRIDDYFGTAWSTGPYKDGSKACSSFGDPPPPVPGRI